LNHCMTRQFRLLLLSLLFLSGFTGLCYEICWIRAAGRIFGATAFAVSSVVALFFAGMALGAHYFGNCVQRWKQPLRVYALLEIGIGTGAMLSLPLLTLLEQPYQLLYQAGFQNDSTLALTRLLLIGLIIIPPTFLMGGTLPLFTQFYDTAGKELGFLYALNSLGAAAGCLLCGFILLPMLGISSTLLLIGLMAQGTGLLLLYLLKYDPHSVAIPAAVTAFPDRSFNSTGQALLYPVIFGTGFCALSYEIIWTRFLSLITHNTVYTYTISLLVTLLGISAGSILARLHRPALRHPTALAAAYILNSLFVLLSLLLPTAAWDWAGSSESPVMVLLICLALMFIPALCSGLTFPLLFDLIRQARYSSGKRVGRLLAVNTAGCVAGSLLTGFILLPLLGMHATLLVTTGLCLLLGILVMLFFERGRPWRVRGLIACVSLAAWLCLISTTTVHLPQSYLAKGKKLVDYVEGKNSFISVVQKNGDLTMELDRLWQGKKGTGHQIMAAHLPMLLHPAAQEILVVGIGAGQAPSRFLYYDITRLDCVDIESSLPQVLKKHFQGSWLNDPRVSFIAEDGRTVARYGKRRYDLISVEVGQIFRPQASAFYTLEFYRNAREKLAQDGIIAQFLPVGFFNQDQLKSVIRTFLAVFPHSTLWYNQHAELLLIGSPDRDLAIRAEGVRVLKQNSRVRAELFFGYPGTEEHFLNLPEVLAASFLMGPKTLANISTDAPLLSNDRPVLEYGTARTTYAPQRFKKLFTEQYDSPRSIIKFTDPEAILPKSTRIQEYYLTNGFN